MQSRASSLVVTLFQLQSYAMVIGWQSTCSQGLGFRSGLWQGLELGFGLGLATGLRLSIGVRCALRTS